MLFIFVKIYFYVKFENEQAQENKREIQQKPVFLVLKNYFCKKKKTN